MTTSYNVIRLSEDAAGESHFDEFQVGLPETKFCPPALPFQASSVVGASGYTVIRIPVGWVGELHQSPNRQIAFCTGGVLKVTASDGDVRLVGTGNAWLMSDTKGRGHWSEVVSDVPFDAVIILVPNPN